MRSPPLPRISATTLRKICSEQITNDNSNKQHLQRSLIETHLISLINGSTNFDQVKQVHAHIYRTGFDQNSFIITKLIRTITEHTSPTYAFYSRRVFNQVRDPNPFLWTALIRGYVLNGPVMEGVELYKCMRKRGVLPLSFTLSAVIKGCTLMGDVLLGAQVHGYVFKFGGFGLDLVVGNTLIDMYVKCGVLGNARKVFDEMPGRDVVSGTSLIVAYAKRGEMKVARELFDELSVKDVVVWTAMVTGYVQNARPKEALELFERMQCCGVEADEFTLVGLISACAQLGTTKYVMWITDLAAKSGHDPVNNVVVGSALVDMYSKCGRVDDAYNVFKTMTKRNVYTYSSMISGFAVHGHFDAAMQLFSEMEWMDIRPNEVTFIGLLTACSHNGMVEVGQKLFWSMEESYRIKPTADHYACMVDLLGRSGRLKEALKLASSMTLAPHGGVWGALLGACNIHNNPDIAEIAASHLFELEPNSIGNYVLLANILSSAGRWDRVSRVRSLMFEKGLKKNPACSWLEGKKGSVHEFFAGDLSHPRSKEIEQLLQDLINKLKLHGYQPNLTSVSYDISDDDKSQILMTHSEKLALAFGLLTSDFDSIIRIMKNLRICEDCHIFMCGASKITGREIVVRDNMRFHHFRDGACSCRNFW